MFSHEDIQRELRLPARAEAREELSVEAWLLRTGHIDQEEAPATQLLPVRTFQGGRRVSQLFAALRPVRGTEERRSPGMR